MPSVKLILSFLIVLTCAVSAQASLVKAIEIHSDYFPSVNYELGFDVNANHLIDRVYFSEGKKPPEFFTLNELQNDYAILFKRWGFEFVRIRILSMDSSTSGKIEMSYLRNATSGSRRSVYFSVRLNEVEAYEVIDLRTGKTMKEALVRTNYAGRIVPVGIRDIESR